MKTPKIVSEIGCNHKGSMEIAKEMVKVTAEFVGADYVKFQKRSNKELLSEEEYVSPHPNPKNSYGDTYGEHREFLEFSLEVSPENFSATGSATATDDILVLFFKVLLTTCKLLVVSVESIVMIKILSCFQTIQIKKNLSILEES